MSLSENSEELESLSASQFLKPSFRGKRKNAHEGSFDWQEIRANLLNKEKSSFR
jgi:hypothetical protein